MGAAAPMQAKQLIPLPSLSLRKQIDLIKEKTIQSIKHIPLLIIKWN